MGDHLVEPRINNLLKDRFARGHGDLSRWLGALERLPDLRPSGLGLNEPAVRAGRAGDCDPDQRRIVEQALRELHPWRKGPFQLYGLELDAEWRSDRKWARLAGQISPLDGRIVLDVGCGNGYYGWRMLGAGAALVLGIDPGLLYNLQFHALRRLLGEDRFGVLPEVSGLRLRRIDAVLGKLLPRELRVVLAGERSAEQPAPVALEGDVVMCRTPGPAAGGSGSGSGSGSGFAGGLGNCWS